MLLTPVRLILGRFKCFVQVLSNDPNIGIALTSKYSKYHDNLDIEAHQNSCHVITWHSSVHQIEFVFSCIFHPGISNPVFNSSQRTSHVSLLIQVFLAWYFWTKTLFNWFLFSSQDILFFIRPCLSSNILAQAWKNPVPTKAKATTFSSINISKCSYPVHCKDSMLQNGVDILPLSDITSLSIDVCICLVRGHLPSPRPRPIALGLKLQRFPLIENFEKTPINCFAAASSFFLISSLWQ